MFHGRNLASFLQGRSIGTASKFRRNVFDMGDLQNTNADNFVDILPRRHVVDLPCDTRCYKCDRSGSKFRRKFPCKNVEYLVVVATLGLKVKCLVGLSDETDRQAQGTFRLSCYCQRRFEWITYNKNIIKYSTNKTGLRPVSRLLQGLVFEPGECC